jgi:hypothetical protein
MDPIQATEAPFGQFNLMNFTYPKYGRENWDDTG